LPGGTFVAVSDDTKKEFSLVEPTMARGDWTFEGNSDGGGLSGLPFPGSYTIEIVPTFLQGIDRWVYLDGDGEPVELVREASAKIISFAVPSACRLNCTVPRCGDGILDAGEVCDDGNADPGDGCAPDCAGTN